ncbi:BglG family transcription antiterminator [Blautia sp.]|uniref:BglG family transcription antiterminator n=1 Tax=Blautia sp. TaxID=1955243 RepID=UPI003AB61C47
MNITPRMKQIFLVLLKEAEPVSVKYLAEQIGVSKRTVQRELEYTASSLKGYEITFMSKTGVGVWLEGTDDEKQRLEETLSEKDDYDVGNRELRRKKLILELLREKGLKKLFYYSSRFKVSEATISSDLEAAEVWLKQYGLRINRKPGSGISVEGSEEDYRRAIRVFVNENIDTQVLREAYEAESEPERYAGLKKSNIGQILNDNIMSRVMDCITGMNHDRMLNLTENSYVGLVIHISIAINRILKNEVLDTTPQWVEEMEEDDDLCLAREIVHELEEEFEIKIPKIEVSYICLHIKGAKHEKLLWKGTDEKESENRELRQIVNEMINAFDPEKSWALKQDDEFLQGLLAHLQPTLVRLNHGMQIRNPVLDEIRSGYPDIYKKCAQVAIILEKWTGKPVPPEEIGFLTVHFGAAIVRMENRKEQLRKVQVGVICSSGIGISRLMSSKLERIFKDRIQLTAYGKKDITPYITSKTDFFVSSISTEITDVPVIYVNPLLNEEDMEKIRRSVYQYERIPEKQSRSDQVTLQLEEINLIAAQINLVIKYMEFIKTDENISFEELLIAVSERLSPYSDRQELIREDIMKREKISSQIFAEFGFALLHTRTRGVVRPGFHVCMTRNLDSFQDPYFKNIKVVFVMLVPIDDNLRINNEILGHISSTLIEDFHFLDVILKGEKEEIRDELSRCLKQYFNKYILTQT